MRKTILFLFTLWGLITPVNAGLPQFKAGSVLLDDETESAFKEWIQEIFAVANLKNYTPHIYLIVNSEVNAAASVGGTILIYSGFLMKCESAAQFLGVMAHEVGHIAGGHVSRSDAAHHQALVPAAAAMILGGALALASGSSAPMEAAMSGGAHLFHRGMLNFSRTQESAADQAGLSYLAKLGWPAEGLAEFLDMIGKIQGSTRDIDPYAITHPLTDERIQIIHNHLRKSSCARTLPPAIEEKFQRIKAKLMAFLEPARALSTYQPGDQSLPARYARAIAFYRQGRDHFDEALSHIEDLLKSYPKDPYFYELKGRVLFERGDIERGDIAKAIPALRKAVFLKPNPPRISSSPVQVEKETSLKPNSRIMLAHALMQCPLPSGSAEAIGVLTPITQKYPQEYPMAWRLLATAQGKSGHQGEADLALAEEAFLKEDYEVAVAKANSAKKALLGRQPPSLETRGRYPQASKVLSQKPTAQKKPCLGANPQALKRAEDILRQVREEGFLSDR